MKGPSVFLSCILFWTVLADGYDDNRIISPRETMKENNIAGNALECSEDPALPENVVNCDLLIDDLKKDFGANKQELCCVLLSSRATRYMCCRQVRDLCESYSGTICPRNRRRIKQPRFTVRQQETGTERSTDDIGQPITEVDPEEMVNIRKAKKTFLPV